MREVVFVLLAYAALALAFRGWGVLAARALQITPSDEATRIWLGWAFALLIFQVLHLAVPLNVLATVPVFLIGITFSIPRRRYTRRGMIMLLVIAAVAVWIAMRSMLTPLVYDAGLYHFQTIRWLESFPIVPGLGNLHGRLGFNQSFFTYAASLGVFEHGSRIANGFLFLLTTATFLARLRPLADRPFANVPSIFALPVLGFLAFSSPGFASPTPDLASELLQLVIFVLLAGVLFDRKLDDDASIVAILAATAITIKLSNLVFAAVVLAIAFGLARRWRVIAFVMAVLAIWMTRGYLTTGAPMYPSTIGHIAFDWAVPRDEAAQMTALIREWARKPNTGWVNPLEWRMSAGLLGVACAVITLTKQRRLRELLILAPVFAGLAFWFFTAPDPRFAHALFFCFAMAAAMLFLVSVRPWAPRILFSLIVTAILGLTYRGVMLHAIRERATIANISMHWQPLPIVPTIRTTTASGLVVLLPTKDDRCWDSPLPCTPYFRYMLRERVPGRVASGFSVTPAY
ncbi:MAG TPA: hypothetical protein VGQ76_09520 [Thermoanaerobaculia bacterium]|jgi:hypothetical protein|nr:hypothetical protein [Thermoanaerobaculia bacterium]